MKGYHDFNGLLSRVAGYGADLEVLSTEKVGQDGHEVQGIWLHPHRSDDLPYFIDEMGAVYQAMFVDEYYEDDKGRHPLARPVKLYPEPEPGFKPLDRHKLVSTIELYFGEQARTEGAAQAEALAIMTEAFDTWRRMF
jgi:hypothetical protein